MGYASFDLLKDRTPLLPLLNFNMSSSALASPCKIRPQLPFTNENSLSNTPRDVSFASYFSVVRDNLTPEFPITPTHLRLTPVHINLTRKRSDDDTEIDIFAAEKYFNDSPNPDPTTPVEKPTIPSPSATLSKSHSLTWTVAGSSCGDASQPTVNSSKALLRDNRRRTAAGCSSRKVFHLGRLGFWCLSCYRKPAVNVNKAKESGSISSGGNFVEKKQSISRRPGNWRMETSSPVTWPSSQRRRKPSLPPSKFFEKEEDDRSDSSSDLFEIESVAMSRTGYEPSEASIAWSVMTASAANVSVAPFRGGEIGKGRKKSAGIFLSGCSSNKAVHVSTTAAAAEVVSSISPVMARYHVDLEAGGGSGRIVAGRANGTSWHGGSGRLVM